MYKKIIIMGDAGRGKSTLAEKLSKKLSIPHYSTDDFFYKVKFTERNDREQSLIEINKLYDKEEWIVEGTTRRLLEKGLSRADVIFLLEFKNIFYQYYFLIRRKFSRTHERWIDLYRLLVHVTKKRYVKGYGSYTVPLRVMLEPYKEKLIVFNTLKDVKEYLDKMD